MQWTLVSHYVDKPHSLAGLVERLQSHLGAQLGPTFRPYAVPQVHGTIIGLEGAPRGEDVYNLNFERLRGARRVMDLERLLTFARSAAFPSLTIRLGGFRADHDWKFTSQNLAPFVRSFSIRDGVAVGMGWPFRGNSPSGELDEVRRAFQRFGMLHKWHRTDDDVDNDFFFVLGRLEREIDTTVAQRAEHGIREWLAAMEPLEIEVNAATLSFVAYSDPRLPLESSIAMPACHPELTAQRLRAMYSNPAS